ncbi:MAG: LptA/OstA family protein [Bdellovibrionota bacterium]
MAKVSLKNDLFLVMKIYLRIFLIAILYLSFQEKSYADLSDDIGVDPHSEEKKQGKPKNIIDKNKPIKKVEDKDKNKASSSEVRQNPPANTKKNPNSKNAREGATKKTLGPDNSGLPVVFESEGLRGLKSDGMIELRKNVIVTQGDFRMDANRANVIFNKQTDEVDRVIARGNVKISKVDPKTGKKIRAKGDTMTFNEKKQTVTIVGNARFWRGNDLVRGRKIIYNLKTGWLDASKVEGVISPGNDAEKTQ